MIKLPINEIIGIINIVKTSAETKPQHQSPNKRKNTMGSNIHNPNPIKNTFLINLSFKFKNPKTKNCKKKIIDKINNIRCIENNREKIVSGRSKIIRRIKQQPIMLNIFLFIFFIFINLF